MVPWLRRPAPLPRPSSALSRLLPAKGMVARLQLNASAPVKKPTGDPRGVKAHDAPAWPSTASARPELRLERAAGVSRQNREDLGPRGLRRRDGLELRRSQLADVQGRGTG